MNARRTKELPPVKPMAGQTIAQFRAVGQDENGKTLYQRVEVDELASSTKKTVKKPLPLSHTDPKVKDYADMTPSLRELRHEQARDQYPEISDLIEGEFVLTAVDRHPLGKVLLWAVDLMVIIAITIVWFMFLANSGAQTLFSDSDSSATGALILIIVVVNLLLLLAGWIGVGIYKANRLFITSERVIQFVANSPFDRKQQAIDLSGIEDVSSMQKGILATLFNYGTVRLSTIGDESTYTLTLVENPTAVASRLNAVIQAVKNDRPVPSKFDK